MIKILIADDSRLARRRLVQTIGSFDIDHEIISEAVDGEEAFEQFKELQPDLVITDIEMPKLSGIDLVSKIKEIDTTVHTLVVSSLINQQAKQRLHALGHVDFLKKPIDANRMKIILLKLEQTLNKGDSRG